jgi:hypothetical protein
MSRKELSVHLLAEPWLLPDKAIEWSVAFPSGCLQDHPEAWTNLLCHIQTSN